MIFLDVTGFYYRFECPAAGIRTVFDLMERAKDQSTENGGVLTFESDTQDPVYCQTITVEFPAGSKPKSRQSGELRLTGKYTYTDDVRDTSNRIKVPGGRTGLHVWQYYITDKNGKLKSGVNEKGERRILGFKESDTGAYGAPLADGDTVTWRLVAIFIADEIDRNMETLVQKADGKPLGLKAAMSMLRGG